MNQASEEPSIANHPRDVVCQTAGRELFEFLKDWRLKHGLLPWEYAFVLNVMQGRHSQEMCIQERNV